MSNSKPQITGKLTCLLQWYQSSIKSLNRLWRIQNFCFKKQKALHSGSCGRDWPLCGMAAVRCTKGRLHASLRSMANLMLSSTILAAYLARLFALVWQTNAKPVLLGVPLGQPGDAASGKNAWNLMSIRHTVTVCRHWYPHLSTVQEWFQLNLRRTSWQHRDGHNAPIKF